MATYAAGQLRSRTTARRFVIHTTGRAGSELLVSLLDSHPSIAADGEPFHDPVRWPLHYVRGRSVIAARRGAAVHGFKLLTMHMRWYPSRFGEPDQFLGWLVADGVDIIHLKRRDLFAHALSVAFAERARYHWHPQDVPSFVPLRIDPQQVLAHLGVLERDDLVAERAVEQLPHLALTYEDDLAPVGAAQATAGRLFEMFRVEPWTATSDFVQITPTLEERISNVTEIEAAVADTRFAALLNGRFA